jgi:hypothetical protein
MIAHFPGEALFKNPPDKTPFMGCHGEQIDLVAGDILVDGIIKVPA